MDRAQPRGDVPKVGGVARVSGEENPASEGLDQEPAPQRAVAVDHATRREVLSGGQGDGERNLARLLPPVEFLDWTDAGRSQQPAVAIRGHYHRMEARLDRPEGPEAA